MAVKCSTVATVQATKVEVATSAKPKLPCRAGHRQDLFAFARCLSIFWHSKCCKVPVLRMATKIEQCYAMCGSRREQC
eukprot:4491375-Amphidinium_carterae.1